jgi:hypothetical protein
VTARLRVTLPDQRLLDAVEPSADVDFLLRGHAGPGGAGFRTL